MNIVLAFICIPIVLICPIIYPPVASFTAIFFVNKNISSIALFLLFSSAIITSLIAATITPVADTQVYIKSFQDIHLFDFTELKLDNDGFEPLYKIYEYVLSLFIDSNQKLFLLITALIFNGLSTIAILRICLRLNQPILACIILTAHYSLVSPALGVPLFLLRSSLSLSILFLAISFYNQIPVIFYLLGTASIFIHSSSLLIFAPLILHKYLPYFNRKIKIGKHIFAISVNQTSILRISLLILAVSFVLITATPSLIIPILQSSLLSFGESDNAASGKAKSFLDAGDENFVDLKNPVVLIQIAVSLLCFLKLRGGLLIRPDLDKLSNLKLLNFLEALRLLGRFLLILIIFTSPFNVLPFRLGFFNFLYFPLWLINVPYLSIQAIVKNNKRNLILFALISVLAYTFYWMPKREGNDYFIVVLEGKPLRYNLVQVLEQVLY